MLYLPYIFVFIAITCIRIPNCQLEYPIYGTRSVIRVGDDRLAYDFSFLVTNNRTIKLLLQRQYSLVSNCSKPNC